MQFIKLSLINNKWTLWVSASVAVFVSFFLLYWLRRVLVKRLSKLREKTTVILNDLALEIIAKTKTFSILATSLFIGSRFLALPERVEEITSQLIVLILIIQSASWGSIAITFWIERHMKKRANEDLAVATTVGLISFLAKLLLYSALFLLALSNFGIDVTTLVAGLGVGGIAVALAAQNILSDLFASLTIVLDKPFIVGDFIIVGEFLGTIEHIGLKTTRLRSLSGEQLIFSNADLLQSRIRNFKRMNERRVVFTLHVVLNTSTEKLKSIPQLIAEAVKTQPLARLERSHFSSIGTYSMQIETVYWVKDADYNVYMNVQQALNLAILESFKRESIQLAYPTQTLVQQSTSSA